MSVSARGMRGRIKAAGVVVATLAATIAVVSGSQGTSHADTATVGFSCSSVNFVVPDGVTSAEFDLYGAAGADYKDGSGVTGGKGGEAKATVALTPGETLTLTVGGAGDHAPIACEGFNGGGLGIHGGDPGGGGGAPAGTRGGGAPTPVVGPAAVAVAAALNPAAGVAAVAASAGGPTTRPPVAAVAEAGAASGPVARSSRTV